MRFLRTADDRCKDTNFYVLIDEGSLSHSLDISNIVGPWLIFAKLINKNLSLILVPSVKILSCTLQNASTKLCPSGFC